MTPHMSMYEYFTREKRNPEWEVVKYFGKATKFKTFLSDIDGLAAYLNSRGVTKGENVAICLPNVPIAAVAFYAVNKCGAVGNVIHPMISEYGLLNIIKKTQPRFIFLADIFYEKYKVVLSDADIVVIVCPMGHYASLIMKAGIFYKAVKEKRPPIKYGKNVIRYHKALRGRGRVEITTGGSGVAAYLHSGGTTGESKTIVLTNYAINAVAINSVITFDLDINGYSAYMVLPLFHGYGLAVNMHAFLSNGCSVTMIPKFSAKGAVRILKRDKINIITGVPGMYEKLLNEKSFQRMKCRHFKILLCGGDSLSQSLRERFDTHITKRGSKVKLAEGYGLTEVVAAASVNTFENYRTGSLGRPIHGVEVKVVDENLKEKKAGEAGEFLIASQSLMEEYLNDPETTAQAVFKDKDGKRWLRTGDYGYIDNDGYLFFKDRIKRIIIISGINVFPSEIESVVSKMEEIKMCCVVEGRDKQGKIEIKLFVVLNEDYKYSLTLENKILKTCKDNLLSYAVPGRIIAKPSLPVTRVGKVDYRQVMNMDDEE